jgi:hypothetical protein
MHMINSKIEKFKVPSIINLLFKRFSLVIILTLLAFLLQGNHQAAAWFGFFVAAYSTMANDSIQTLGTFLSSHQKTPWWLLWLVFGLIMIIVILSGWFIYDHQLGFERLKQIPPVHNYSFYILLAPVILVALTQLKIPISTTFLILSIFSSDVLIHQMLLKSFFGYVCAFTTAAILWKTGTVIFKKFNQSQQYNHQLWQAIQWIATGFLWSFWLVHDTANMVVFLPRNVEVPQLTIVLITITAIFGLIMYQRGLGIQEIVYEKKDSQDIRAATLIDGAFALVLAIFIHMNKIPMSTTWVFLGILGGRELIVRNDPLAIKLIINDIGRASIGIVVSLVLVFLARGNFDLIDTLIP